MPAYTHRTEQEGIVLQHLHFRALSLPWQAHRRHLLLQTPAAKKRLHVSSQLHPPANLLINELLLVIVLRQKAETELQLNSQARKSVARSTHNTHTERSCDSKMCHRHTRTQHHTSDAFVTNPEKHHVVRVRHVRHTKNWPQNPPNKPQPACCSLTPLPRAIAGTAATQTGTRARVRPSLPRASADG